MPLAAGDDAPTVTARNQDGEEVSPAFEEPTVVYFYPKDDTPGCTVEANQFQRERETYRDAGVDVYGVSVDDVDSHRSFSESEASSSTCWPIPTPRSPTRSTSNGATAA